MYEIPEMTENSNDDGNDVKTDIDFENDQDDEKFILNETTGNEGEFFLVKYWREEGDPPMAVLNQRNISNSSRINKISQIVETLLNQHLVYLQKVVIYQN